MKVLTLIKAKSNVFLWYVQCCSCMRRSKTKILTTRAPPFWIEFDVVTSQPQAQCDWIDYLRLSNHFSGFYKRPINAGTWKSTMTSHIKMSRLTVCRNNVKLNPRWRRPSRQYFGFRSSHARTAFHVSRRNITFYFNQGYYFGIKKRTRRSQEQ